jgi:hypothetical protein
MAIVRGNDGRSTSYFRRSSRNGTVDLMQVADLHTNGRHEWQCHIELEGYCKQGRKALPNL